MKSILSVVCCVALCCAPALAQKKGKGKGGHAAGAGMTDQQFVDFAGQTDMLEANVGQFASQNAVRQDIKDYAQMLTTDHTNDYNQLTAVAGKANLTVPKGLDPEHEKMAAALEKLKGGAFETRFITEMISGHTQAIAKFKWESENGTNADLKAYATQDLATLQKHLDGAKDLSKKPSKKP
jgi:putative membrane protein